MSDHDDSSPYRIEPTWTKANVELPNINWWFVAGALLLLITGVFAVRMGRSTDADDGFVNFEPDISLFPSAPVSDATTVFGIAEFDSWPTRNPGTECPYYRNPERLITSTSLRNNSNLDWRTVRHDWSVDGSPRSWVVGERIVSLADTAEFDNDIAEFRNAVEHCDWLYNRFIGKGYKPEETHLEGLPNGSFAFIIKASPEGVEYVADESSISNPADFHGLGAVLPGRRRGTAMFVTWTGWATEVPADEFVATANRLFDAAHDAPAASRDNDNDTIDFTFTNFEPDRAGVLAVVGGSVDDDDLCSSTADSCPGGAITDRLADLAGRHSSLDPDEASRNSSVVAVRSATHTAVFTTARFAERADYLDAADEMKSAVDVPRFAARQHPFFFVEPLDVDGLPEGALAAVLRPATTHTLAAVVTDDQAQLILLVTWYEESDSIPTGEFAEAVELAWADAIATNGGR